MGKAADRLKAISKKTWLFVAGILITAVICLAAAVNYSGSRSGTLDGMEWQKTEDGSYELECFRLGIARGEYTINVFYDSEETLSYRLVDMQRNSGENELGFEIAKGTFPAGKTETRESLRSIWKVRMESPVGESGASRHGASFMRTLF